MTNPTRIGQRIHDEDGPDGQVVALLAQIMYGEIVLPAIAVVRRDDGSIDVCTTNRLDIV
jgi:hypothetical protein